MASKLFTFRCPQDLREQIDTQSTATGKDKTAVVIDMLRQSLPSVSLDERYTLPDENAIYFVYQASRLLYIGRTASLLNRWINHHRWGDFNQLEGEIRISWFSAGLEDQPVLEESLIDLLEPEMNGTPVKNSKYKSVTVYIPPELESKLAAFCLENGLTRKDSKTGETSPALGTGLLYTVKQFLNEPRIEQLASDSVTPVSKVEVEDLVKGYYAQAMEQMNGMLATLREEVDARLGEFQA